MLRYKVAWLLLAAHRLLKVFGWRSSPQRAFRIVILHDVPPAHMAKLADLVDYIKDAHGLLSPGDAVAILEGKKLPPTDSTPCLLTFDDGFESNFDAACSVLDARDVKAIFFVCPGLMGVDEADQPAAIDRMIFDGRCTDPHKAPKRLMTWAMLRSMTGAGHAIGAHGMSHARLSRVTSGELKDEVAECVHAIEVGLGRKPDWYAYAFGDIDSISDEALAVIGEHFSFCRSGIRGVNTHETNRLAIRADMIDLAAPKAYQRFVLGGGLDVRYIHAREQLDLTAKP